MKQEFRENIIRLFISLLLFIFTIILPLNKYVEILLLLISYLIIGWEIICKALSNIKHGELFDENFLMLLATIGAIIIGEYHEAILVVFLYQIGEMFQDHATEKSKDSIIALMNIKPDYANIEKDGQLISVNPENVNIGTTIIVKPGEKIPLDGIVINGNSSIDISALTGESMPINASKGTEVFSGSINKTGILSIQVTKDFSESSVSKILELVEKAADKKSKSENFITKFSKVYTPIVVIVALLFAFLPPLFIEEATFYEYIYRACSFLVISCPCALVISVPLAFFTGIGCASKKGILIKGANNIEALSKTSTVVLDKTGTLTKGNFKVTQIKAFDFNNDKLLEFAAYAEYYSDHPVANSIKEAFGKEIDISRIKDTTEISGEGITATIDNKKICIGNSKLMHKLKITPPDINEPGTCVHIAIEDKYIGYILITDEIKEEAKVTIKNLKSNNDIKKIIMLTGDSQKNAATVAENLNITKFYAELLPENKVEKVKELLSIKPQNSSLLFVGDGINDAPVLKYADVSIAMGGLGSDAAIEAADVVIMDDNIAKVNTAINLSKYTLKIVKQNIFFSLLVKFIILALSALGRTTMWGAIFADVGISIIAILNSMRVLSKNKI